MEIYPVGSGAVRAVAYRVNEWIISQLQSGSGDAVIMIIVALAGAVYQQRFGYSRGANEMKGHAATVYARGIKEKLFR